MFIPLGKKFPDILNAVHFSDLSYFIYKKIVKRSAVFFVSPFILQTFYIACNL